MKRIITIFILATGMLLTGVLTALAQETTDALPSPIVYPPADYIPPKDTTRNLFVTIIFCAFDNCPSPGYTCYQDSLPYWYKNVGADLQNFMSVASQGRLNITDTILTDGNRPYIGADVFQSGGSVYDNISNTFTESVLDSVDAYYNFANSDRNNDGYADYVVLIVLWPLGRGGIGLSLNQDFTTNDPSNNPNYSHTMITGADGAAEEMILYTYDDFGEIMHEFGHNLSLNSFGTTTAPGLEDMDHFGTSNYNEYTTGSFDVMTYPPGFKGTPSVYNPMARDTLGWISPTIISGNIQGQTLTDYLSTGQIFEFRPSSLPSNAYGPERYYVTYHTGTIRWEQNWPLPLLPDGHKAGLMIWRALPDAGPANNDIADSIEKPQPIAIQMASGKYDWTEYPDSVHNTGVPDPLTGFDSLEVRKVDNAGHIIEGPYNPYGGPSLDWGSEGAFFTPNTGQDYAFYTNPSSNYLNANDSKYARDITSGFAVKDIRYSNGTTTADFYTNDYTVSSNATLVSGTYYINGTVTIANNATLTVSAGATLDFASGASLIVDGSLVANSSTFTASSGAWNGITINANGSSLTNCTISSASLPLSIDNATTCSISDCTIDSSDFSNGEAILVDNSTPTISGTAIEGQSGSENGVWYENNSAGTLSNCVIENLSAGDGVILEGNSSPTISGNKIKNIGSYGIICNSDGTGAASIDSNIITENRSGLVDYGSIIYLTGDTSSSNTNFGIYCQGGCQVFSGADNEAGDNLLTNNAYGIDANNESSVTFGGWTGKYYDGTCNSVYGNTNYDLYCFSNSTIFARYDWWGVYPPNTSAFYVDGTSTIDDSLALSSPGNCPIGDNGPIAQKNARPLATVASDENNAKSDIVTPGISQDNPDSLFEFAQGAQMDREYKLAGAVYRSILNDTTMAALRERALVRLFNVFQESKDTSIISDFQRFTGASGKLGERSEALLGYAYEATGRTSRAEAVLNDVISRYPGTRSEEQALISLASMRFFDPTADRVSSSALDKLVREYGSTLDNGMLLSLGYSDKVTQGKAVPANNPRPESVVAVKPSLENYPNPFNPTTVIKYAIPSDTHVTIRVYDILGRVVATLVDGAETAGTHEVTFDGSKLASGVYFYRLTTPTYSKVMKMLMLK